MNEQGTLQTELRAWYSGHFYKARDFAERFERHLAKEIRRRGLESTASLEIRTKAMDSFVAKAAKALAGGTPKYTDPKTEITDVVGARVLVPLSLDLEPVFQLIRDTYSVLEELDRGDEEERRDAPGYRSKHFVVRLSDQDQEDVDFREFADMCVEIQVRTILQHAWAELQHDLDYKAERPPSSDIKRRLTSLAGLLELAEREFGLIRQVQTSVTVEPSAIAGGTPGNLTAASLRAFAETVLGEEESAAQEWFVELATVTRELQLMTGAELVSALGDWLERAPRVASVLRDAKPWINSAYVIDALLRLALRERYFNVRLPLQDDEPRTEEETADVRREFLAELDSLAEKVQHS